MNRTGLKSVTGRATLALGAALLFAASSPAAAFPGGGHGRGFHSGHGDRGVEHMLRGLDLSDAQRQQVKDLFEQRKAEAKPLREAMRSARRALHEAVAKEPLDEAAIRAASAEVARIEADLAVSRARGRAAMRALLTPEQKAQLDERERNRRERREERMERLRDRNESRQGDSTL